MFPLFSVIIILMKTILVPVTCPKCGHEAYVKSEQFIIPAFNQKHRLAILDGTFFRYICPVCQNHIQCIHPCLYHDHEKHLLIAMQPIQESKEVLVRAEQEPIQRLVHTPDQMRETIQIFEDGFHDVPMAYLKGRLIQQFEKHGEKISNIFYHDYDQQSQYLWFDVVSEQESDLRAIPLAIYQELETHTKALIDDTQIREVSISDIMNSLIPLKKDC